jgi:hypothetical protein
MHAYIVLRTQISLILYGVQRSRDDDLAGMRQGFGSWEDSGTDGEAWVERLRSGSRLPPY